jgi:hypothetical protein
MTEPSISFCAEIYKLQTLVDGGWRISMDLSDTPSDTLALLAECKHRGVAFKVICTPDLQKDTNAEISTRSEWEPKRSAS